MMKFTSKFRVLAAALILGAATLPRHAIVAPPTTRAVVIGSGEGAVEYLPSSQNQTQLSKGMKP